MEKSASTSSPISSPARPYLLVLSGPQTNTKFELDFNRLIEHTMVIGRQNEQTDIMLFSPTNQISRRHLLINFRLEDHILVAADAGSSNGTRLNGKLLIAPTPLLPGDILDLGDVRLKFMIPELTSPPDLQPGQFREDFFAGFARLEVVKSSINKIEIGSVCRLTPGHPFTFGRNSACDLRILQTSEQGGYTVSRHHSEIRQGSGNSYVLRDTGATNPTLLNGQPLREPHILTEGDLIEIGGVLLRYRQPRLPISLQGEKSSTPDLQSRAILRYVARWALCTGPNTLILPLDKPVHVGRGNDCELRLIDPSVSRHHAIIETTEDGRFHRLKDLGSKNGTLVNGSKIPLEGYVLIKPGDRLTFGEYEFLYDSVDPSKLAKDGLPKEKAVLLSGPITFILALDLRGNLLSQKDQSIQQKDLEGAKVYTSTELGDLNWLASLGISKQANKFVLPRAHALTVDGHSKKLEELLSGQGLELSLEQIISIIGFPVPIGGNQPFLLEERDTAWYVRSGRVEVFAVQFQEGQPISGRHHVCTVPADQALICEDPDMDKSGLGLLAVAQSGTELIKITISDLRYIARQPHLSPSVKDLVDGWLTRLSESIAHSTTSQDALLEPGSEIEIGVNQKVSSRRAGVWARVKRGQFLSLGAEDLSYASTDVYFPLYGNIWLQALSPSKIRAYQTSDLIDSDKLWLGLQEFYDLFFRLTYATIRLSNELEINRLSLSNEYDSLLRQHTKVRLAGILDKTEPPELHGAPGLPKDFLLLAADIVAKAQGIELKKELNLSEMSDPAERLHFIMRASRVRIRQIKLTENWWQHDQGPFLAYLTPEDQPVAILSQKGRYVMINPVDNSTEPITPTTAANLQPSGYVFYRSLPVKVLRARDLLRFGFKGSRKDIYITILLGILGGLLGLFVPLVTGYIFDSVIPFSRRNDVWQIFIGIVVVELAIITFQITRSITLLRLETRMDVSLQAALWDRLLELPVPFFRNYSTGDLANRTLSIDAMRQILSASLVTTILSSIFSLFNLGLLFFFDVGLALVALGLTVVSVAAVLTISLWQLHFQRRLIFQQGRLASLVLQLVGGIAKLRVAGAEIRAYFVWVKEFTAQRRVAFRARSVGNLLTIFNSIWPVLSFLLIFYSVNLLNSTNFSTGSFLAFVSAYTQFLTAILAIAVAFITALHVIPIYERAKPIFETLPEVSTAKIDPGKLSGAIELNHVSFRYSPKLPLVLNDISLKIKPGEFVAIVGPSGSGKSSLFRLLLGFENPETGSIYYDNQDLKGLDVQSVRRQMGVVTQNGKLMAGDIFSNIVGSSGFSQEEAWEAARLAGMEEDIKEMPMGMFTVISDSGSALSGGQRQRLMIARAIISRPRILLFDEATSALDNQTQAIVSESLEKLQATRLVIAHRLSTVINAHYIYVVMGGKIVQSGTYAELINQEGSFKELVKRQTV